MNDLAKRLRIKAGMIEMGEMIAWGSDSALMREAADALEMAAPAAQGEPVAYLRQDQLRKAQRMGAVLGEIANSPRVDRVPVYDAPQPAEQKSTACVGCEGAPVSGNSPCAVCGQKSALDVSALVDALEGFPGFLCGTVVGDKWIEQCRAALTAYRNQGVEP